MLLPSRICYFYCLSFTSISKGLTIKLVISLDSIFPKILTKTWETCVSKKTNNSSVLYKMVSLSITNVVQFIKPYYFNVNSITFSGFWAVCLWITFHFVFDLPVCDLFCRVSQTFEWILQCIPFLSISSYIIHANPSYILVHILYMHILLIYLFI